MPQQNFHLNNSYPFHSQPADPHNYPRIDGYPSEIAPSFPPYPQPSTLHSQALPNPQLPWRQQEYAVPQQQQQHHVINELHNTPHYNDSMNNHQAYGSGLSSVNYKSIPDHQSSLSNYFPNSDPGLSNNPSSISSTSEHSNYYPTTLSNSQPYYQQAPQLQTYTAPADKMYQDNYMNNNLAYPANRLDQNVLNVDSGHYMYNSYNVMNEDLTGLDNFSKFKRPMNAYMLFSQQRGQDLLRMNPNLSSSNQAKILDQEWSTLDERTRHHYQEQAERLKMGYLNHVPDFTYGHRMHMDKSRKPNIGITSPEFLTPYPAIKDKNVPKRPMNAYLIFNKVTRPLLLKANPNATTPEISKEIGLRWKNLSPVERQTYLDEANAIRHKFFQDNPGYIFTRQTKQMKQLQMNQSGFVPTQRGRRKKEKDSLAPKHPMSAFLFYLVESRSKVVEEFKGCPVGPISKIVSKKWNALSDEEKKKWNDKATLDKQRYARELKEFQECQKSNLSCI